MKIYLARHGQTNYNDLGLCNADPGTDVHLTPTGIQQVKVLAKKLRHAQIDQIFASELKRTQQTAEIIKEFHNVPIKIDARLNDNRTGYEDRPAREYYAALDQADDKWSVRFNDGESLEDVKARAASFIDELRTKTYTSVLIVTSEVIVHTIYGLLNDLTNEQARDLEVDKASCVELELPQRK